jgi:hypothetical protein
MSIQEKIDNAGSSSWPSDGLPKWKVRIIIGVEKLKIKIKRMVGLLNGKIKLKRIPYYCNGICESCSKGKYFNDEEGEYYTCDPEKVKDLEVIPPLPYQIKEKDK